MYGTKRLDSVNLKLDKIEKCIQKRLDYFIKEIKYFKLRLN